MVLNESFYGQPAFFSMFVEQSLRVIKHQGGSQVRIIQSAAHRRVGNLVAEVSACFKTFRYTAPPVRGLVEINAAPVLEDISADRPHISYLRGSRNTQSHLKSRI